MGFIKDLDNSFCINSGILPKNQECILCDSKNVQIFWHDEKAIFVCAKCLDTIISLATDAIIFKACELDISVKRQLEKFIERICATHQKVLKPKNLEIKIRNE